MLSGSSSSLSSSFQKVDRDNVSALGTALLQEWSSGKQEATLRRLCKEFGANLPNAKVPAAEDALSDEEYELFSTKFRAREHFQVSLSHKSFIVEAYQKLAAFFPNVAMDQAKAHDNSKVHSFVEIVGYTEKWIWKAEGSSNWHAALRHHYESNPHHPEYHVDAHGKKTNMPTEYLEESVIDMIACRWERKLAGKQTATVSELADIEGHFLTRYTEHDRKKVLDLTTRIRSSSGSSHNPLP